MRLARRSTVADLWALPTESPPGAEDIYFQGERACRAARASSHLCADTRGPAAYRAPRAVSPADTSIRVVQGSREWANYAPEGCVHAPSTSETTPEQREQFKRIVQARYRARRALARPPLTHAPDSCAGSLNAWRVRTSMQGVKQAAAQATA